MEPIKKEILETENLILLNLNNLNKKEKERFVTEQVEEFKDKEILENTKICEFLNGRKYTLKDSEDFVNLKTDRYVFAIYTKQTNKFVGVIGIDNIDNYNKNASPGYWAAKSQRGKGYMTQALKEVIKSCFEDLKLHKLNISAFDYNIGSNKIIQKLGFELIGTKKENIFRNGKYYDENIYELLKSEWKNN